MTILNRRLGLLMLFMIPSVAVAQPATGPQPTSISGSAAYVYKTLGDVQLRLHVFSPAAAASRKPAPAVVFFFGGGWTNGTVQQFVPQATHLADRGMIAVVADYRVFARHQTSPFEAIADAKSAIRWLRASAARLGIDPARIAASGGSAGGHIALAAATLEAFDERGETLTVSSKPDALVLFNPAVDTSREEPAVMKERFMGRGRDASPQQHVKIGLPPTLILHGKADTIVPYAAVERFCADSRKLGNRCELIGYEGAPHGFFNPRSGAKWHEQTMQEMDAFLTRIGYLSANSSSRRR
jgi:acetyl esterase